MKRITAIVLAVLMALTIAAGAMGEENRIWQLGDTGEKVTWIQTRLKELEYLEKEPDGIFDEETEAALMSFQRDNGLLRTGMADSSTMKLLETSDRREAEALAAELCSQNRQRQELELSIWKEAVELLGDRRPDTPIVLAGENWHPGVIGIVASRLTDAYGVPAVMICLDGENGKGSCRSIGSFNLYEAVSECSDCLEGFGGHAMAAGITIRSDMVDDLRRKLGEYYLAHPDSSVSALEAELRVDDAELLSMECVESLDLLLYLDGAVLEQVTPIGGGKHLRLRVSSLGESFDCVFFSQTAEALGARAGQTVDLIFVPQINEFRSRRSVQLVVTDLRPHQNH